MKPKGKGLALVLDGDVGGPAEEAEEGAAEAEVEAMDAFTAAKTSAAKAAALKQFIKICGGYK